MNFFSKIYTSTLSLSLTNKLFIISKEGIITSGGFANEKKLEGEDMIAQLETLRNLKEFLTEKIKENEINMGRLRAEIEDFKNQLRIQKQINSKSVNKIQVLENKIQNEDKEKQELINKIKENEEEMKKIVDKFLIKLYLNSYFLIISIKLY